MNDLKWVARQPSVPALGDWASASAIAAAVRGWRGAGVRCRRGGARPDRRGGRDDQRLHRRHRRAGAGGGGGDRRRPAPRGGRSGRWRACPSRSRTSSTSQGLPTRAGSLINRDRAPAAEDAELVRRMRAAGAVLLGALNMGEFAYDFTGENAHDGACRNPHDPARMSGGSSSGCGAATAAGIAPISLGSDTNGSLRVPASLCGVFSLKPTYGRLPRTGAFPFVDSLDHLGPMARTARGPGAGLRRASGPRSARPRLRQPPGRAGRGRAGGGRAGAAGRAARRLVPHQRGARGAGRAGARGRGARRRERGRAGEARRGRGRPGRGLPHHQRRGVGLPPRPAARAASTTSIPTPATGSSPARCCRRPGSCARSACGAGGSSGRSRRSATSTC